MRLHCISLLTRNSELVYTALVNNFSSTSPKMLTPKLDDSPPRNISQAVGLSSKVVEVPKGKKVGPGASKDGDYKHPEYFCFNVNSYYEAEIEMAAYRLPQPSSKG